MQPLIWYFNRLRTMSVSEINWRVCSIVRNNFDSYQISRGLSPYPQFNELKTRGFSVSDLPPGAWASTDEMPEKKWYQRLVDAADRICRNRLTFFDRHELYLGDPIDWNKDHKSGKHAPLDLAHFIDYRDFQVTGDCKFVWEPNRHHQMVVLARAYRASGDHRYAQAVADQLDSWLNQCPFGRGMNWRSPLELGIRLINWVWALDLVKEAEVIEGVLKTRLIQSVYCHLFEITRKYSRGSSGNNHLIGEAAGVFVASSYFNQFKEASRWRDESRDILAREILEQTFSDGCTREQAFGYQLFVLQFLIVAGLVGRWTGNDFQPEYWQRIEIMISFLGRMKQGGKHLPMVGDGDDGYVLNLGSGPGDLSGLLSTGAILFGRPDFKQWSGGYAETARWLLGAQGKAKFNKLRSDAPNSMRSHAFSDSGYYLLQSGSSTSPDKISISFDAGQLGFGTIAAHGHADALSFTLRAFENDIFVDPGTYDYFTYPEWRKYFRSTRAHNTIEVDDLDQSEMMGSFMWGKKANSRCTRWDPTEQGGIVVGEHDGYRRLSDPVTHRRTLMLDGDSRILTIKDDIIANGRHRIAIYFHLSEECEVSTTQNGTIFNIAVNSAYLRFEPDKRLTLQTLTGSLKPIGGWISRGYHCKAPCTTIVASFLCNGQESFCHRVVIGKMGSPCII